MKPLIKDSSIFNFSPDLTIKFRLKKFIYDSEVGLIYLHKVCTNIPLNFKRANLIELINNDQLVTYEYLTIKNYS